VTWSIRFRLRQWLRSSLWLVPLAGAAVGLLASSASVALGRHIDLPSSWEYSAGTAGTLLSTVAGAMVGLIGFVVTISVLVVQMATGTFSARYMRLWYRDPVLKAVLAWLFGTLTFSYSLLRQNEEGAVPNLGVTLAGAFVAVGVVLFLLFLDRFVHRLRPVAVAALVAAAGRQSGTLPQREISAPDLEALGEPPAFVVTANAHGVIQAVDHEGLVSWAERHDAVLVFLEGVGDFVSKGTPLVEVHATSPPPSGERELIGKIALGVERTIEQDIAFSIRIMVDIANKALSAAVNDPTTATQVLNHLSDVLRSLGRTRHLDGVTALADGQNRVRVLMPSHRFVDLLSLGVTEIRQYGAGSIQVMRRLRALLEDLRATVLPEYVDAVDAELARLDATVAEAFGDGADFDLAQLGDPQGIGGPPRLHSLPRVREAQRQ
jgi:uncharacterized membrane protein